VVDAFPVFNQKYGQQLPDGTYQVPAPWQSGLSNVSLASFRCPGMGVERVFCAGVRLILYCRVPTLAK
jgi:hypothetical protein